MATTRVTPIQLLRSEVNNKRPDPEKLLPGQGAVNTNFEQPGLFFADNTGTNLFKVGPCYVGELAPNDPNIAPVGAPGNTVGELWLDTSPSTRDRPTPLLKVWNGSQWISCMPYTYANTIVSDTEPALGLHPDGTLWWDSGTGLMYVLYSNGPSRQWTQVSSAPVS
jgi:hypothetical protein